ncbi:Hypothetical protein D9617_2g054940 [Elsinoe fawcettii]|nr:Hypothetical protein D9617_2g054940 [Elsinoe fawcettii]
MDRRFRNARSPKSDTDGSEDVFLDLAEETELSKSDDDFQEPASRLSHRKNDIEDEDEHTLKNLPGQFPDRTPQPKEDTRPRSSGYLSSFAGQEREVNSRAQHQRHVSQPNGGLVYSSNLASTRHNRQVTSRYGDTPGSRYQAPVTSFSQIETPRLRRQRNLYADTDGPAEERQSYLNEYRGARPSSLKPASPAQASPAPVMNQAAPNDSDSVGSQTAASTVWDELDELKSRIKRLETTGQRLPSTANAAIASHTAARPQTATTAPTTVSSSPQQLRKQLITPSEMTTGTSIPADVHPTLQSALSRARSTLTPQVYRPLEAAVMDSLAMAAATGRQASGGMSSAASTINGFGGSDRQTRRKVDSLCRNLADLCIAMCDSRSDDTQLLSSPTSARKSRPASPRHHVRQSVELEESRPEVPAVPQSRRTSRTSWARTDEVRTPRLSISGRHELLNDLQHGEGSPSTTPKDYTARYSSLGRGDEQRQDRRLSITQNNDEPSLRAPSRAMTDIGRLGFGAKRDHLRTGTARSPSLRETLEARRRSANMQDEEVNDTQSTVSITGQTPAARRFLDRVRGTPSEVGSSISGTRPRLGSKDYQTPSPRLATPAARTSSIGQRRFAT